MLFCMVNWMGNPQCMGWLLLLAVSWLAGQAGADVGKERQVEESPNWQPAFSFFSGLQASSGEAAALGPRSDPPGTPLSGDGDFIIGYVGLDFEVSSPQLGSRGAPRIFGHFGPAISFDSPDNVAGEGAPGGSMQVVNGLGVIFYDTTVDVLPGQGTTVSVESEPLILAGGLGLSFDFKLLGRKMRVKPSAEWTWQKMTVSARLGYAEPNLPPPSSGCDAMATPPGCPTLQTETSHSKGMHFVGPGLEVEVDAGRAGPLMMSLYASGRAYRVVSDREVNSSTSQLLSDGRGPVDLSATFKIDPWLYRAAVGLRFRWMPE